MFQFAGTIGIATKAGYDYAFPEENTQVPSVEDFKDGITREVYFDLPKYFPNTVKTIKPIDEIKTIYSVNEPHFHFSHNFFTIPDQTDLGGYYQTEKYFEHCQELIRSYFEFDKDIVSDASSKFPKFSLSLEYVSIHLRKGDYAGLQQFHPVMDPDYYSSALSEFTDGNYCFLIFSDDIEYSKDIFGQQENVVYIEGNDPAIDMCMMSMCDHNIIANSSFSWWAAWLNQNPNKKVIAPKKWFGPAYNNIHDTKDLYPKSWIVV
jgi:hypothetical protein